MALVEHLEGTWQLGLFARRSRSVRVSVPTRTQANARTASLVRGRTRLLARIVINRRVNANAPVIINAHVTANERDGNPACAYANAARILAPKHQ